MNKLSSTPCLIVTLCKSLNYGAYLQAFALQEILTAYGYQVSFLDVYDKENNIKRYQHLFGGIKNTPKSYIFNIRKLLAFKKYEKKLTIVSRGKSSRFKVVFIGSDEVWSVTNGSFNSAPEFFGINLPKSLKFSYAPSVRSSNVEDLNNYPKYVQGISELSMISVRDIESLEVAKKASIDKDISMVLDPTFLHDFFKNEEKYDISKPYILVYTYGFEKNIVKEVKAYARRNKLLIISAGFYHSWADKNIACNPFEFLSIVRNANSVITDTFHGSIFAIKYRKNFISYGGNKPKVKYLLESLGLEKSLVEVGYLSNDNTIETTYSNLEAILNPKINESRNYLEQCNTMIL
ncbi:polysaccharide pyruvyl transferase family protein [Psychrobacter cibarius]|uniref:polysaccharide pyruvyl transferase family protein n=2 Tax=Psychrobacter cibarius TaxID=282669 RepID=UPI0018DFA124|nr:polysaccharide pyruvyl transferase family protein [Psychrobacter cibarius]